LIEGISVEVTLKGNRRFDPGHPLSYGEFELLLPRRVVHIEFQPDARGPKIRSDSAGRTHSHAYHQLSPREVYIRNHNLNSQVIREGHFVCQFQRSQALFVSNQPNPKEIDGEEGQSNEDAE
jgi:hypothetical protein